MKQLNLQEGYQLAYSKACTDFAVRNPRETAANSGSFFDGNKLTCVVRFLNCDYMVTHPDGRVLACDSPHVAIPVTTQIIVLHYLLRASGFPLTQQLVSFKEIPDGGMIYFEPFRNRVLRGLTGVFGNCPELLKQAGVHLGGTINKFGDASVTLMVLPKIPVTYIVWSGDEEFAANATALFDANVSSYLCAEDLVVVAAAGASLLCKTARAIQQNNAIVMTKASE